MKMTYMCLPENESSGIRCKISLTKRGHSVKAQKKKKKKKRGSHI